MAGRRLRFRMLGAFIPQLQSPGMPQAIDGIKDGQRFIERHERAFKQALAKTTHRLGGLKLVAMPRYVMSDRGGVGAYRRQQWAADSLEGSPK